MIKKKTAISGVKETIETILIALVLASVVRAGAADARFIPSESMLPTLAIDDRLIVDKVSRYFGPPQHGDIIVFRPPSQAGFGPDGFLDVLGLTGTALIKRVVGLPGDRLAVHDGKVWRNGIALQEPYVMEGPSYRMPDPNDSFFHEGSEVIVPKGSIFAMGDNRNNSADSHVWGFLPFDRVLGRALFRYWPPNRIGLPG